MAAEVISGKDLAREIKEEIAAKVPEYVKEYGRAPHLAVILVGEDPASMSYVKSKGKDAEQVGFRSTTLRLPETTSEEELLEIIAGMNADDELDGVLVQLPLPKHIDEDRVIAAISKEKDVDGFHPLNVAALWQKTECIAPCTPDCEPRWSPATRLGIVLAAEGYPGAYRKDVVIKGAEALEGIYHMGTKRDENGELKSAGGRVMMVTSAGADLSEARSNATAKIEAIEAPGLFHRTDIGAKEA